MKALFILVAVAEMYLSTFAMAQVRQRRYGAALTLKIKVKNA